VKSAIKTRINSVFYSIQHKKGTSGIELPISDGCVSKKIKTKSKFYAPALQSRRISNQNSKKTNIFR